MILTQLCASMRQICARRGIALRKDCVISPWLQNIQARQSAKHTSLSKSVLLDMEPRSAADNHLVGLLAFSMYKPVKPCAARYAATHARDDQHLLICCASHVERGEHQMLFLQLLPRPLSSKITHDTDAPLRFRQYRRTSIHSDSVCGTAQCRCRTQREGFVSQALLPRAYVVQGMTLSRRDATQGVPLHRG